MMQKVCDRCKKIIDEIENSRVVQIENHRILLEAWEKWDLCERCMGELREFIII